MQQHTVYSKLAKSQASRDPFTPECCTIPHWPRIFSMLAYIDATKNLKAKTRRQPGASFGGFVLQAAFLKLIFPVMFQGNFWCRRQGTSWSGHR